jgi:hypothetical protein
MAKPKYILWLMDYNDGDKDNWFIYIGSSDYAKAEKQAFRAYKAEYGVNLEKDQFNDIYSLEQAFNYSTRKVSTIKII